MIHDDFLLGENTDNSGSCFVVHTAFPQFIIDLENFELEWLEEVNPNQDVIKSVMNSLLQQASDFYNREFLIKKE